MKRNLLSYLFLTFIIGFVLTSCSKDDDYIVKSNFDYRLPVITRNGNFEVHTTIYVEDIPNINLSRESLIDIYLRNAWVNVSGDLSRNDDINIHSITINGKTLLLDYRINIANNVGDAGLDIMNDDAYVNFMYDAMNLLNNRGKIDVVVDGDSYMTGGKNLYITLCNNLDLTVREY